MDVTFFGRSVPASPRCLSHRGPAGYAVLLSGLPAGFTAQTQWIVDHREELNIVYVAHEGTSSTPPALRRSGNGPTPR